MSSLSSACTHHRRSNLWVLRIFAYLYSKIWNVCLKIIKKWIFLQSRTNANQAIFEQKYSQCGLDCSDEYVESKIKLQPIEKHRTFNVRLTHKIWGSFLFLFRFQTIRCILQSSLVPVFECWCWNVFCWLHIVTLRFVVISSDVNRFMWMMDILSDSSELKIKVCYVQTRRRKIPRNYNTSTRRTVVRFTNKCDSFFLSLPPSLNLVLLHGHDPWIGYERVFCRHDTLHSH